METTRRGFLKLAFILTAVIAGFQAIKSHYFRGEIDDIRIYDHILSSHELQQNYIFPPVTEGLVGWWQKRG